MAAGFFDSVALTNHNHTAVAGDGGVLTNLSVTGTISASGIISTSGGPMSEVTPAASTNDIPTYSQAGLLALLGA